MLLEGLNVAESGRAEGLDGWLRYCPEGPSEVLLSKLRAVAYRWPRQQGRTDELARARGGGVAGTVRTPGARVLVVEDEPVVRKLIERLLLSCGYNVQTACDGTAALAMMGGRACAMFDLVLTDLHMPGMGGVDLLQRIREMHPHCAVLLMTGTPDDLPGRDWALDGERVLVKPFGLREIIARVETKLASMRAIKSGCLNRCVMETTS